MDIRTHSDFAAFATAHAADVRRLAALSPRATVFQTWEWGAAWWRHHGGRGRRFFAIIVAQNETVVGAALLYRDPFTNVLRPVGGDDAHYGDILAHPDHEESTVRALLAWLTKDGRFRLEARHTSSGGVLAAHVARAQAASQNAQVAVVQGDVCPAVSLPRTWDAYTQTLGKRRRAHIGYHERLLRRRFAEVLFAVADTATLAGDTEALFALHERRWNARWLPGAFAGARARRFHTDATRSLLAAGLLRLHTLIIDGRVEAALCCFAHRKTVTLYQTGFEPELACYSPGSVLTARAIRYAIEHDGATRLDFLRGNESHKYGWGAADVRSVCVVAGRRGLGVPLAGLRARAELLAQIGLRRALHARFGGAGLPRAVIRSR